MKLFARYNRLNILAASIIFVLGSVIFYLLIRYVLIHEVDEGLQTEQQEIVDYVSRHQQLPEFVTTKDQRTFYRPVTNIQPASYYTIRASNGRKFDRRRITFGIAVKGQTYAITVEKPLDETQSLLQLIIAIVVGMIALILLLSYLINRIVIGKLWQPFYDTINTIKCYRPQEYNTLKFEKVTIDEFSLLNETLNNMTQRIAQDYESLKGFTAQAAHEMQTPVAIMRAKIDMLMQNDALLKTNGQQIAELEKSVNRLSRLNQSLLLLTKVENKQYVLNELVQLDILIYNKVREYNDIIYNRDIDVKLTLNTVNIVFHTQLAEILVGNLLQNAIRYNVSNGTIQVILNAQKLIISNTSDIPMLDNQKIFKRFYRYNNSGEGNGLGLSIIKEISDAAGFQMEYVYDNNRHSFVVTF